jgi:Nif-specific regulatory protein
MGEDPSAGGPSKPDRLGALYSVASLLSSLTDSEVLLRRILEVAVQIVPADRALLFTLNPITGDLELSASQGLEEDSLTDALDISRGVLREAAAGKRVITLDAQGDEALRKHRSVAQFGIRSILCAPLVLLGEPIGILYVDSRQGGPLFLAEDLEFLEVFAQQAALAIDFSRRVGRLQEDTRRLKLELEGPTERFGIVGRASAVRKLWETIERVAPYSMPALIHGESGTGKELVARAIHAHGPRRSAPFLAENCAALPETLLESELFGHTRGAFTGADRDQRGLFEQADGGTLFLDEIGEMSPNVQAKLLRVLQDGEIRPLGSEQRRKVDVRILAATNRDPAAALEHGQIREDLFYRLAGLRIEAPPLRERKEDIPLLFSTFVERQARQRGAPAPRIDPRVWKPLLKYDWPGNVRELQNEAGRLSLLCLRSDQITIEDLERHGCVALIPLPEWDEGKASVDPLVNTEKKAIARALRASSGNRDRAARLLGISRATLFRKIRRYHLQA